MNEKLIVKNFGPIRDAELELKKTTVFIGPQGSGKSTLAKLLTIFKEHDFQWTSNDESLQLESRIIDYGLNSFFNKNTELDYFYGNYKLTYRHFRARKFQPDFINPILAIQKEEIIRPLFFPAERSLISLISDSIFSFINQKIDLPKTIIEFGANFEFSKKRILSLDTFLGAKYEYSNGKDIIHYNNSILELSESASGFQSMIPLLVVLAAKSVLSQTIANDATLSIIEEPELNLYPTTQKKLVYYLTKRCTENENELLMTTHSPYVLTALNLLLLACKVWQKHPEREAEIAEIVPKESWLNPEEFAAYYVADGTVRSITDPSLGLIDDNELDDVSVDNAGDLELLMNIYRSKPAVNETVH